MEHLEPPREKRSVKNEPAPTSRAGRYKAREKRQSLKDVKTKVQESAEKNQVTKPTNQTQVLAKKLTTQRKASDQKVEQIRQKMILVRGLEKAVDEENLQQVATFFTQIEEKYISQELQLKIKNLTKDALGENEALFLAIVERYPESLKALLKTTLTPQELSAIKKALINAKTPFASKIAARYTQLEEISKKKVIEKKEIKLLELLQIACFIELDIVKLDRVAGGILKRKDTGLSRTLQYDVQSKQVYLLANKKLSQIKAAGSFKKVTSCAALVLADTKHTKVLARVFTKAGISRESLSEVQKEVEFSRTFSGKTGFLKMHAFADYTVSYKNNTFPRISLIVDVAKTDLFKLAFSKEGQKLQDQERIKIALDVSSALSHLHLLGLVHGDFKPENVMFLRDASTGAVSAAIIDFGCTRKMAVDKLDQSVSGKDYRAGFYATPYYSAPELLGVENFKGDNFKVEAFAFGTTLFELRFGKDAPWTDIASDAFEECFDQKLRELKKDKKAKLIQYQQKMTKNVEDIVLAELAKLEKKQSAKEEFTNQERYDFVMYKLLHPNPEKRLSIIQAAELFSKMLK
jgi:hypothetical protein